ncbi:MAG TPA: phosphatase PAP2 family protein [Actinotalea sp.]
MSTPAEVAAQPAPVPQPLPAQLAAAVGLLSVAGTAALLDGVQEHDDLTSLDSPTLTWLVAHRQPMLTTVMTDVSTAGGALVVAALVAVAVLVLLWRHRVREASLLAGAVVLAEAVSLLLKHLVARPRPPEDVMLGPVEHTLSFPSGHTIVTGALVLTAVYLWWRARPGIGRAVGGAALALGVTALMAASRLYLGDHWLTDVLASAVLAWGVLAAIVLVDALVWDRLWDAVGGRLPRRRRPPPSADAAGSPALP